MKILPGFNLGLLNAGQLIYTRRPKSEVWLDLEIFFLNVIHYCRLTLSVHTAEINR